MSKARLNELIEEALVDAYGESEELTGFYTMLKNTFVCRLRHPRQRIPLTELPLPSPPPAGSEWIQAYRYWRTGKR